MIIPDYVDDEFFGHRIKGLINSFGLHFVTSSLAEASVYPVHTENIEPEVTKFEVKEMNCGKSHTLSEIGKPISVLTIY